MGNSGGITRIVYTDPNETMVFTTDNEYWIKRIITDAEKHPDEITIISLPEQNDGSIKARLPFKYLEIRPDQIRM